MSPVTVQSGDSPVILGLPHGGTFVPAEIFKRLNDPGQGLDDTDWHISQLYDGLLPDVTTVTATFHRYVIDANRDPEGVSLYPGQNTTGLCPLTDFDGRPIWRGGQEPSADEIGQRCIQFHKPYHDALAVEIERVRAVHGYAILYDCHSIRSEIPFLFDGLLPIFNIGTNNATTCAAEIEQAVLAICSNAAGFDHVLNGRFKGGWTTRHYGVPEQGVHALQMEIAQRAYMNEQAPWTYRDDLAAQIRPHLSKILRALAACQTQ
uniref:N-formylglutamate deformylase n=1 Tax=Pararhizobium sp. IMCC3301 TaxID=3067904 RepID=UPI0027418017|nr:N-formylglutamate deformylase [Pararhizobium sp. IMCC3301]